MIGFFSRPDVALGCGRVIAFLRIVCLSVVTGTRIDTLLDLDRSVKPHRLKEVPFDGAVIDLPTLRRRSKTVWNDMAFRAIRTGLRQR